MTSNRERCISMAQKNIAPPDIACALKIAPGTVHGYLSDARKAGVAVPYFKWNSGRTHTGLIATMSQEAAELLRPDAAARGLSTERLAARLLEAIARDHMVDAILDDEVARNG